MDRAISPPVENDSSSGWAWTSSSPPARLSAAEPPPSAERGLRRRRGSGGSGRSGVIGRWLVLRALAYLAQAQVSEEAGVVAVGPDGSQRVSADPFHTLHGGLLRGQVGLQGHDARQVPLAGAQRARACATQVGPAPLAEMAVIPADAHHARGLVELDADGVDDLGDGAHGCQNWW